MRKYLFPLLLIVVVLLAGCGSSKVKPAQTTTTQTQTAQDKAAALRKYVASCPGKPDLKPGQGQMGVCAPKSFSLKLKAGKLSGGAITWPDRSNNNPVSDGGMRQIHNAGHPAIWLKGIEGLGYDDPFVYSMTGYARHYKMAPGVYDFVRTYSYAEAQKLVNKAKALGVCTGARQLPVTLDIEAGYATRSGVQTMVNKVRQDCGRVTIYTGGWYWGPLLGNWYPSGVTYWISGYPNISGWVGPVDVHQYSSSAYDGAGYGDMSVWVHSSTQFNAYIHVSVTPPKPRPTPARQAHLHALYKERVVLRTLLLKNGCRVKHPRKSCSKSFARGQAVNKEITYLRSLGVR